MKLKVIAVFIGMLLCFIYGMATVQYKIFPFDQFLAIKKALIPSSKPIHSAGFYIKKSFFEQHGRSDYDAVFIGDSLIDTAEWDDLFPSFKIANRGVGGDRTDGVLKRLDSIYSTSASRAFIMIGINDFGARKSVDEVFNNYKLIAKKLTEHGMKVYIQSTIYAGKKYKHTNPKITELNERLKLFATDKDSIEYIDLNASLAQDFILRPEYSVDDIHINGSGYAVWREIIKPYLQ